MDPTVGTFAGFIAEPTDVLTMDIHLTMEATEDMEATEATEATEDMEDMEATILTPTGEFIVHPISGHFSNAIVGTRQAQKVEHSVPTAC